MKVGAVEVYRYRGIPWGSVYRRESSPRLVASLSEEYCTSVPAQSLFSGKARLVLGGMDDGGSREKGYDHGTNGTVCWYGMLVRRGTCPLYHGRVP